MNIREIIEEYLLKHHFDGLFNEEIGCSCLTDSICNEIHSDCKAGYKFVNGYTSYIALEENLDFDHDDY